MALAYQQAVLAEALEEDGLTIMAPGLGLHKIVKGLIQMYSDEPGNLVLVLQHTPDDERYWTEELINAGAKRCPTAVTYEWSTEERKRLYLSGGVLLVTTRILLNDVLTQRLPLHLITGFLVLQAHTITDTSNDHFILRKYRRGNSTGFIKAFSEAPEAFVGGFNRLEKVMKALFVRRLYLWPRFQVSVAEEFDRHPVDTIQLFQPMTHAMTQIQRAIVDVMNDCLKEMKATNRLDVSDLTVENNLFKAFDRIIRNQLDPIWHKVGPKTKQLVSDLRTLRNLLTYLICYDCVSYYQYVETLRSCEGAMALWVFMSAAHRVFSIAKSRVYSIGKTSSHSAEEEEEDRATPEMRLVLHLEENPKWQLLVDVLEEINNEIQNGKVDHPWPVLVVCSDARTCFQLRRFLHIGGRSLLERTFHRFLTIRMGESTHERVFESHEERLLYAEAQRLSEMQKETKVKNEDTSKGHKRRRRSTLWERMEEGGFVQEGAEGPRRVPAEESDLLLPEEGGTSAMGEYAEGFDEHFGLVAERHVIIAQYREHNLLLDELRPKFVVMYEPNLPFVRKLEVFRAENPGVPLRVYLLYYKDSIEDQRYLSSVKRESDAFTELIRAKSMMVMPTEHNCRSSPVQDAPEEEVSDTRSKEKSVGQPRKVVVDTREFRSSLPNILDQKGMEICMETLEVGDYILSPEICVERKSISDLYQSFNSGRLYTQVETMSRHYKTPVLLIEFEENKSFSLQASSGLSDTISPVSIVSKIVLLSLQFPMLRMIWSRSPHATADIFMVLKRNRDEPQVETAIGVGVEGGVAGENHYNTAAMDMLRRFPGITPHNMYHVMHRVESIQELCNMSLEALTELLGPVNAQKIFEFVHYTKPHMGDAPHPSVRGESSRRRKR